MASANVNDFDAIKSEETTQVMDGLVETETWERNTVPTFYRGNDIPADEMALSIVHIREQLFSLMTPEDLFNCRRLNRNWNSYATAELQERFELKCTIKEENLGEYLNLLQNHQEIFPCLPLPIFRKYSFEKATLDILSDPMLQQFLSTYGYFVRDLSLIQNNCPNSKDAFPSEKDVMDQVRRLLIYSAPNLSSLTIDHMDFYVEWEEKSMDPCEDSRRPLRTTDPEFDEIHSIPETEKNDKLKFFSFNSISGKMFELAVQLAPNLEEIQVPSNFDDFEDHHKYFMEPLNRLRFYKDLQYSPDSSDLFKKFADLAQEGNLKLRQISFIFGDEDESIFAQSLHPAFLDTCGDDDVDAINKLLACSWDSLETIRWKWVMGVSGLKWPEVMPNVWKIIIGPRHTPQFELEAELQPFPPNFNWSQKFPRLRHLEIYEVVDFHSLSFRDLLTCFHGERIDSVVEVHVLEQNSGEQNANTLANFEQLRGLFPSAQVFSTQPVNYFDMDYMNAHWWDFPPSI